MCTGSTRWACGLGGSMFFDMAFDMSKLLCEYRGGPNPGGISSWTHCQTVKAVRKDNAVGSNGSDRVPRIADNTVLKTLSHCFFAQGALPWT